MLVMKVLFYLVHPAHFHLFKNVIKKLQKENIETFIIIRPKESLETLCITEGFHFIKVNEGVRKNNKFSMFTDMIKRDYRAYQIIRRIKPDLLIGSSVEIAHVGKLLGIPSVITHEDDYDNMKFFSYSTFPFASRILSPEGCRQGKWQKKCTFYRGYHELSYLHPNNFLPNKEILQKIQNETYFLLRFSQFTAHHDFGASGISDKLAGQLIELLKPYGKIIISSERKLSSTLEQYRTNFPPSDIHNLLYSAKMLIGDSQSMTMEAAVLGVPTIRFNKFAENYSITVIDELEEKYKLAIGINNENPEKLISTVKELLKNEEINKLWQERRQKMLEEKIDTCVFFVSFIKSFLTTEKNKKNIINK